MKSQDEIKINLGEGRGMEWSTFISIFAGEVRARMVSVMLLSSHHCRDDKP
jgi:hypothetical protein